MSTVSSVAAGQAITLLGPVQCGAPGEDVRCCHVSVRASDGTPTNGRFTIALV